jgi:hypothetical protein
LRRGRDISLARLKEAWREQVRRTVAAPEPV